MNALHQVDDPQAMTHYRCRMHASQGGPGGRDFEYGDGEDWNHVKPGTPLITQIDAALP